MKKEIEGLEELEAETDEELEKTVSKILEENVESHRKILSSSIEGVSYTSLQYEIELEGDRLILSILYTDSKNKKEIDNYRFEDRN